MPLKLNVGLARKVGEANYGSRGASVNMELEVDGSLAMEPAKLQERIRRMFVLVRASLDEELGGHGQASATAPSNGATRANGNGSQPRRATQSQVKALHAIAKSRHLNIGQFLQSRFQMGRPDDLSIKQASQAIDELKALPAERG
jgi:hypothetical protein